MRCGLFQLAERDVKLAALHAQTLHGGGDGLAQCRRRFGARGGDEFGLRQIRCLRAVDCALQRCQIGGRVQLLQFLPPAGQQLWQLCGRALVAARQADPTGESFIQLVQALRFKLGMSGVAIQGVHRVFSLRQGAVQNFQRAGELRLNVRLPLQCRNSPAQQVGRAVVGILQGIQR